MTVDGTQEETVPVFYANVAQVAASGHDFVIGFGLRNPLEGSSGRFGSPQCTLFISPSHFKRLTEAMTSVLQEYEQHVGVIPVPPRANEEEGSDGPASL